MRQITQIYENLRAGGQRLWQCEQGANLVLIALIMPVLLSFAGLALDGSNAYLQQQRMQVAADAAALGGALRLALGYSTDLVEDEAQRLADLNGADSATAITSPNDNTIQVTTIHTFDTFFAGIMGYYSITVSASASANVVEVVRKSAGNLMPMTIACAALADKDFGDTVTLYDKKNDIVDKDGNKIPGNFGWLTWNGDNKAPTLVANILNPGNSGTLYVTVEGVDGVTETELEGAPGAMSGAIDAFEEWRDERITIPLYGEASSNGSHAVYKVCGFAEFVVRGFDNDSVWGEYVRSVARGEIATGSDPDYGARDVRLTQ